MRLIKILLCSLLIGGLLTSTAEARGKRGYSTKSYKGYKSSGTSSSYRSTHVKGYTKKNGTYVAPHYRSKANKTEYDNWSTKGNTNPYTGKKGTKTPRK